MSETGSNNSQAELAKKNDEEKSSKLNCSVPETRTYKTRWLVLGILSLLIYSNSMSRIAFGPVAYTSATFYDTEIGTINWMAIVYMIVGIPFGLVATFIMDKFGLRLSLVVASWVQTVGSVLRTVSAVSGLGKSERLLLVFLGHILSAIAQPFFMFAPTKVAAIWFPDNQRAIANTIATTSNPLGIMTANILSPVLVKQPSDILTMLIVFACPTILGSLLATIGIRTDKPKIPPSVSANEKSEPFWIGIKQLVRNRQYWIIFISIGGGIGIYTALTVFLEQILCPWGYTDFFAGVIGGSTLVVAGVIGALIAGIVADRTKKFIGVTKFSYFCCMCGLIMFVVLQNKQNRESLIAVSIGVIGFFGLPLFPLGNELIVETTYPVESATSSGLVFLSGQLQGMILIVLLQHTAQPLDSQFKNITRCRNDELTQPAEKTIIIRDMSIPTYVLLGYTVFVCLLFVTAFRTRYRRQNVEERT